MSAAPLSGKALVCADHDGKDPKVECLEEVVAYAESDNRWCKLRFDRVSFPNGKEASACAAAVRLSLNRQSDDSSPQFGAKVCRKHQGRCDGL